MTVFLCFWVHSHMTDQLNMSRYQMSSLRALLISIDLSKAKDPHWSFMTKKSRKSSHWRICKWSEWNNMVINKFGHILPVWLIDWGGSITKHGTNQLATSSTFLIKEPLLCFCIMWSIMWKKMLFSHLLNKTNDVWRFKDQSACFIIYIMWSAVCMSHQFQHKRRGSVARLTANHSRMCGPELLRRPYFYDNSALWKRRDK